MTPGKFTGKIPLPLAVIAAFAVIGCILPRLVQDTESSYLIYVLFQIFLFITLAQGWNLVAGYTGQISLGQHAFFGSGAYVTAIFWNSGLGGYFDPFTMLLSGLAATLLAILIGIPLLSRLRGDYFALGTLGLGEILRVIVIQGGAITGGSSGLILPSGAYTSITIYYYCSLALALFATLTVYLITKSRRGLALVAVRDCEIAAAASGIHILKYKVVAFAIGAFFTGLCGSLQAYYLFQVSAPNFFSLNWTLYPVIICVLGGVGTVIGPIAGAFVLTALFEVSKEWLPMIHPILSGVLVIVVILFLPGGILRTKPQQ
ncbi:MAG: branched-chain amino acid ABC transporter permease [Syntrophales bacterium]